MKLKRPILASIALSTLALTLGIAPAQSDPAKPEPTRTGAKAGPAPDLDAGAAANAAQNSPAARARAAALSSIQDRIANRVRSVGGQHSYASYLDPASGKIVIETDAPAGVVASLTGAEAALVEVRAGTVTDTARKTDTAPFYGGAGIKSSGGICSSGFTVKKPNGVRYLTTAGHCATNGTAITTELGNLAMGTVSERGLPSFDMELIGGKTYSPYIFVGGVNSTTANKVVAAGDPSVGFNAYCHSGRTTGEQCSHTATSVTAQVCTSSGCKSPVIAFTGGTLPQGGDSGSPFYAKSGTSIYARGTIIAVGSTTAYAEKWSRMASRLNVSIVT